MEGSLFLAVVLFVFVLISIKYTPKTPSWFGYKTRLSMRNNNTWVYANNLVNRLLGLNVFILVTLAVILRLSAIDDKLAFEITSIVFTLLSIVIIPIVEIALKRKFDEKGNLK